MPLHYRRLVVALLLGSLPAAAPWSRAIASEANLRNIQVHIDRADDGRGVEVQFVAAVTGSAASVLAALEDASGLPGWVPRMKAVDHVEPQVDASVRFDSTMHLPWPVGDVHERVVARREVDGATVRLRWEHVGGDMRRNDVVWTVTPIDAEHCELRYDARLWFKGWLPVFLIRLAERGYAPWFVDCLERRAAALATAAAPPQNAASNVATPRTSL
jgi:hypothetical protein